MRTIIPALYLSLITSITWAQDINENTNTVVTEYKEEVVVYGRRPGPRLWKVSKGDHVLWIFGYLTPLPKHMEWDSDRVAEVLASANEFLWTPNIGWSPRTNKALRRLPDKRKLQEVLPADSWSHYLAFVQKNFGRDKDIEILRPILATSTMQSFLYNRHDLANGAKVIKTINKLARKNKALKRSEIKLVFPEELRARLDTALIDSLSSLTLEQEIACFDTDIDRIMPNIRTIQLAANAWADGDIGELDNQISRRTKEVNMITLNDKPDDPCTFVDFGDELRKDLQAFSDQVYERWLAETDRALNENNTTFVVLGIQELFRKDGLLQRLRERGYEVKVPEKTTE